MNADVVSAFFFLFAKFFVATLYGMVPQNRLVDGSP